MTLPLPQRKQQSQLTLQSKDLLTTQQRPLQSAYTPMESSAGIPKMNQAYKDAT